MDNKYSDIINLERPEPSPHHPRMSMDARAAQFAPFAALKFSPADSVNEDESPDQED